MIRDNISDGRIFQNAAAILGRVFIADSTLEIHSYFLPVKAKKGRPEGGVSLDRMEISCYTIFITGASWWKS